MNTFKHFLDTSVLRPMLLGTRAYRKYFDNQFGDDTCYASQYVQMEFKRSYLCVLIDFHSTLSLSSIDTIGEAITLWANRFKGSEHKAVLQMMGQLLDTNLFDSANVKDKSNALLAIGRYIKRLEIKLRRQFKDVDQDSTRCARAAVPFKANIETLAEDFKKFVEAFDDVETCRSKCSIDDFMLKRYKSEVDEYTKIAVDLASNQHTRGFKDVVDKLSKASEKGGKGFTCTICAGIGDAVIALDVPRNIRLEHTDNSFDYLCPSIDQPHQKHPSEASFVSSVS